MRRIRMVPSRWGIQRTRMAAVQVVGAGMALHRSRIGHRVDGKAVRTQGTEVGLMHRLGVMGFQDPFVGNRRGTLEGATQGRSLPLIQDPPETPGSVDSEVLVSISLHLLLGPT